VARGELALHRGDTEDAIASLRQGVRTWCEVDDPYEAAEARVRLARALTADGDQAGARLEIKAAARAVEEIGAVVDLDITPPRPEPATRAVRTFLFSDIVGSTRLAEAMGDDTWEQLLRWHDRILRAEFARWRGEEVKHGGDGFFVAFAQPDDATAPTTASLPPSASGFTPERPPPATTTTSARPSPAPPASLPPPEPARSW
jgi:class 3 adenylate cyclase